MKQSESNTLQRELARSQPAGPHPDADLLTAFAEGTLLARERAEVMTHLATCTTCREVVSLAAAAAPEAVTSGPQLVQRGSFLSTRWAPWFGIAAAVGIVSTAMLIHQRTSTPKPAGDQAKVMQPFPFHPQGAVSPLPASLPAAPPAAAKKETHPAYAVASRASREQAVSPAASRPVMAAPSPPLAAPPLGLAGAARQTQDGDTPQTATGNQQNAIRSTNETVSVTAEPVQLETAPLTNANQVTVAAAPTAPPDAAASPGQKNVDKKGAAAARSTTAYSSVGGLMAPRAMAKAAVHPQWRINENGHPERSFENGVWQAVLSDEIYRMHVVSVVGNTVWVGGEGQRLYRSIDDGTTWTALPLPAKAGGIHTITHIQFASAQTGTVAADDGTSWTTTDGGATWY